jgi:hypothetical protein
MNVTVKESENEMSPRKKSEEGEWLYNLKTGQTGAKMII